MIHCLTQEGSICLGSSETKAWLCWVHREPRFALEGLIHQASKVQAQVRWASWKLCLYCSFTARVKIEGHHNKRYPVGLQKYREVVRCHSQNCRMAEVGRLLWRSSGPTPPLKLGHVQAPFDCLQGGRSWLHARSGFQGNFFFRHLNEICKVARIVNIWTSG